MRIQKSNPFKFIIFLLLTLLLGGCAQPGEPEATPTTISTPTPVPTSLVVCLGQEPNTLYPYGDPNRTARQVLQAVFESPVEHRGYEYQPTLLQGLPSLSAGTAIIQTVEVLPGDKVVVGSDNNVIELDFGDFVRPSGCTDSDCAVAFDGTRIAMDQIVVLFDFLPGLTWADGAPLTAADSVFGFNLAADQQSPGSKYKIDRTLSYEALSDTQIKWTGLPGFIDQTYMDKVWTPVPQHLWDALSPADLLTADFSARTPVGYGPYSVQSWSNNRIILRRNPAYFRAAEGLPLVDQVIFQTIGTESATNLDMLLSGECDLLDETAARDLDYADLQTRMTNGQLVADWANRKGWESVNIGIVPAAYDNGYSMYAGDRADFFGDPRARRAIAQCIDRVQISQAITSGIAPVMDTYVPPDHPLFNSEVPTYSYDPAAANQLLDEIGWTLEDPEGIRLAGAVTGVISSTRFSLDYFYLDNPISEVIAQIVSQNLLECGVEVQLTSSPDEQLYDTGEDGLVFPRKFDLAQFPWNSSQEPPCYLYLGDAISGEDTSVFRYGRGGWNLTGWQNEAFDAACKATQGSAPPLEDYTQNHLAAQQVFAEELPVIPLFTYQDAALARPDICGFDLDPTAGFAWNIENLAYGQLCP